MKRQDSEYSQFIIFRRMLLFLFKKMTQLLLFLKDTVTEVLDEPFQNVF